MTLDSLFLAVLGKHIQITNKENPFFSNKLKSQKKITNKKLLYCVSIGKRKICENCEEQKIEETFMSVEWWEENKWE